MSAFLRIDKCRRRGIIWIDSPDQNLKESWTRLKILLSSRQIFLESNGMRAAKCAMFIALTGAC